MSVLRKEPDIEDIAIALHASAPLVDMPIKELLDVETQTYTREIFIPAGTLVVGKQHAKPCVNIITQGKLLVKMHLEDDGKEIVVPKHGTYTFVSQEFGRKLLYVVEDTVFINVFSNVEAKHLDEVEAELVIPSEKFETYIKEKELVWHGH